jgi:hypothetical protein
VHLTNDVPSLDAQIFREAYIYPVFSFCEDLPKSRQGTKFMGHSAKKLRVFACTVCLGVILIFTAIFLMALLMELMGMGAI